MRWGRALLWALLGIVAMQSASAQRGPAANSAEFAWFEYRGDDAVFYVEAPWLEHIIRTVDMDDYMSLQYFQRVLRTSGIIDKLEEMGIDEGDTVDIFGFEFDFVF
jgi:GTP-binding protein